MNDAKRASILFVILLAVAAAAFLTFVAFAFLSAFSSGTGARGLMWAGVALSALFLAAGISFLIIGSRRKKS